MLVLRFSSLGDIVLTSAALDALKKAWPQTRVVFAVKSVFADLVKHSPHVDEVLEMRPGESAFAFAKRLRAAAPDAILDLHRNNRSRALRMLVRGPKKRVVWSKRPFVDNIAVRLRLRPYRAAMTISERYHRAVEALAGRALPKGEMRLWHSEEDGREAARILAAEGIDTSRPLVGMSPGATAETKRWPADRFAEIARRLSAGGLQIVVTGSKSEQHLAAKIGDAAPQARDLTGRFGIGVLAGVIAHCHAFVANDSGPMHMARALSVPTLAFFGSTDPRQFVFDGHAVLYTDLDCAPCSFFGKKVCPEGHFRCMLDLDVERAWSALQPLLRASRPVGRVLG